MMAWTPWLCMNAHSPDCDSRTTQQKLCHSCKAGADVAPEIQTTRTAHVMEALKTCILTETLQWLAHHTAAHAEAICTNRHAAHIPKGAEGNH